VGKKLFYRIGEACKQLDIQPYVLRYWETEFPVLSPRKSKAGQRVYSEEELQLIHRIKQLLYEEGYTIAGAKKKLEAELASGGLPALPDDGDGDGDGEAEEEGDAAQAPPASASPPTATALSPAAVEKRPASAPAKASGRLDTEAAQQVERFRTGVQEALAQAREILQLLP
jgi:DNA-binding transcriptional MerR regulator